MNIPDLLFENLVFVFGLKIHKFFDADQVPGSGILPTLDPGSGILSTLDPGSGIRDKHPGSAILCSTNCYLHLADNSATGRLPSYPPPPPHRWKSYFVCPKLYRFGGNCLSLFIFSLSVHTFLTTFIRYPVQYIHLSSFAEASLHC